MRWTITCRRCGAGASYFANTCPRCGAQVVWRSVERAVAGLVGAALALVLVIAVINLLASKLSLWRGGAAARGEPPMAAPVKVAAPSPPIRDVGWIAAAMAECDAEAARNPTGLYFLVIPVMPADPGDRSFSERAVGTIGRSVHLLRSADTLEGLRLGALTIYPRPFVFSFADPSTGRAWNFRPSTGVAKFVTSDVAQLQSFRPGLSLAEPAPQPSSQSAPQPTPQSIWADGIPFPRDRGVCYWTVPLIPH
jgi:hypothetical protein